MSSSSAFRPERGEHRAREQHLTRRRAQRRMSARRRIGACCRRAWLRHRTRGDGCSRAGGSARQHRAPLAATANAQRRPAAGAPRSAVNAAHRRHPRRAAAAPAPGAGHRVPVGRFSSTERPPAPAPRMPRPPPRALTAPRRGGVDGGRVGQPASRPAGPASAATGGPSAGGVVAAGRARVGGARRRANYFSDASRYGLRRCRRATCQVYRRAPGLPSCLRYLRGTAQNVEAHNL